MENQENKEQGSQVSRREFLKSSAAATAGVLAAQLPLQNFVHAAGNEAMKIGLIGCGGRGCGAIADHLRSVPDAILWSVGDYFDGSAKNAINNLKKDNGFGARVQVTPERCFSGFDAYKQVIDSGVDLIVTAAPPGFRPLHFSYAVEKGKHVFMEKPVATCPAGIRMVIEAAKKSKEKGLGVVAGTQRRHELNYCDTIQRIHDGAIGEITAAQCYWNGSRPWNRGTDPNLTEIEQQIRNWYHYVWLCGDHIVEQHVHNLDVINWVFSKGDELAHPVRAMGVGGLTTLYGQEPGQIWDNFAIEYEYPNGVKVLSMCRHWAGCPGRVSEFVWGTKGKSNCTGSIEGDNPWKFQGQWGGGYQREHADLVASIRAGKPLNEGEQVATSTAIAIMGRMAAYTGQEVTWDFFMNKSQLNLLVMDPKPGAHPVDPLAIPGKTKLI